MAKLRWGERGEGEVTCPAPSTWVGILLIVTTRAAAYPSWHLSSGSWLAGLLFLKKSLRWVWEAERGKEPTFVEVYSSKYSVRNFISIREPLCDPPSVNVWFFYTQILEASLVLPDTALPSSDPPRKESSASILKVGLHLFNNINSSVPLHCS